MGRTDRGRVAGFRQGETRGVEYPRHHLGSEFRFGRRPIPRTSIEPFSRITTTDLSCDAIDETQPGSMAAILRWAPVGKRVLPSCDARTARHDRAHSNSGGG